MFLKHIRRLFGEIGVNLLEKTLNIIHKKCDKSLSKDKSLPINSYIITYIINDEEFCDIVQANGFSEVFDNYYDEYGKNSIQEIKWTEGRINPKIYGYQPKESKKRK